MVAGQAGAAELTDRWVYLQTNLQVDKNVEDAEALFRRAAKAGYTGVLLSDSKMAKLGDVIPRYHQNVARLKSIAAETKLEVIPALFHIGYSEPMLWHDPNLAEALPVEDALFVVRDGVARVQADSPTQLRGGDFVNLKLWGWKDPNLLPDNGALRVTDPKGANSRVSQKLQLKPFRQYHLSVRVKTQDFHGKPEVKLLAAKRSLNHADLGVKATQDWTLHHVVFNSLDQSEATLYLGCWGGETGSLWWKDVTLEETALVNLVRRPGAPFTVKRERGGGLVEGQDFEPVADPKSGTVPWKGAFEVWHEPPAIKTKLPDGTRLRVSFHHVVTVNEGQVMVCPSEPKTVELLRDEAKRVHAAWGARSYMMSHDEIRCLNWCAACQARKLTAGQILADNARTCVKLLREVNPGGRIFVWSDMFDPNHNAKSSGDYYLVRGDLTRSWEGLDKGVGILPWYFGRRAESLKFFADRGHPQVIAGYYDSKPEQIRDWLAAGKGLPGLNGVMYTTWQRKYGDLEKFIEATR
ncbi:MAG: hypothetical protein EBS05_00160 [Proteobacteria bacterium]|nr:hypothetical protein [Pseudomonadota bacterium]